MFIKNRNKFSKNIGIVCYWFNRGQATVGRHVRSIIDQLGYQTFVLARPTKDRFVKPGYIDTQDVWKQDGVQKATNFQISFNEYHHWVKKNKIGIVFFDQNYQFDEIEKLRKSGVITIGRFVWESFSPSHVESAKIAFDIIYSLTLCEKKRYHNFGIDSPLLRWGVFPDLIKFKDKPKKIHTTFFYPGGYLSPRKPTGALIEAFSLVKNPDIRLIIKTQTHLHPKDLIIPRKREDTRKKFIRNDDPILLKRYELLDDPRIIIIDDDLSTEEYLSLFSSCDVCIAPSRWEGLGLHLYEAIGFGLPIITNNIPPMNEIVRDRENGYLVESINIGRTKSGIDAFEPDILDLSRGLLFFSDPDRIKRCQCNMRKYRKQYAWDYTVNDYQELLQKVTEVKQ
jgi:glycosyltransferase involved in cell wall biosynthesis